MPESFACKKHCFIKLLIQLCILCREVKWISYCRFLSKGYCFTIYSSHTIKVVFLKSQSPTLRPPSQPEDNPRSSPWPEGRKLTDCFWKLTSSLSPPHSLNLLPPIQSFHCQLPEQAYLYLGYLLPRPSRWPHSLSDHFNQVSMQTMPLLSSFSELPVYNSSSQM